MTLVLTDSGLGGLSVLAYLTRELEEALWVDPGLGMKLVYVNAVPRDGYGYNDMPSRKERINVFNGILETIQQRFKPEQIFVVCGSLSAILDEIPFARSHPETVEGIEIIGRRLLVSAISKQPEAPIFVFASPTTIREGIFAKHLSYPGNLKQMVINQPCPGLASMISSDYEKVNVQKAVLGFCSEALSQREAAQLESGQSVPIVFLGCTHYSFRSECFVKAFASHGFPKIQLLDPNPAAAKKLLQHPGPVESDKGLELEFLTPYHLPDQEILTISALLENLCHRTAEMFRQAHVIPELIS